MFTSALGPTIPAKPHIALEKRKFGKTIGGNLQAYAYGLAAIAA